MKDILSFAQIVISILLILAILAQNKSGGLSETFGGSGSVYTTKRGLDKLLSQATVVLAILFLAVSLSWVVMK